VRLAAIAPLCVAWATSGCWLALGLEDKDYTLPGGGGTGACDGVPPMPVISRDAPAYASDESYPAEDANDDDYSTAWRSGREPPPAVWLAYDLSTVDPAARTTVVAIFYNGGAFYDHAAATNFQPAYSNAGDYVIQASAAPGGDVPDESSWETLAEVTGNTFNARQHVLDFTGYQWIRMSVSASDGSDMNRDVELNFDVHGAPAGVCDDWIVFGDTIAAGAITTDAQATERLVPQRIAAADPARVPLVQPGGMDLYLASDGRAHLTGPSGWLALFPGRFVAVAYGWEDAKEGTSPESFHTIMGDMVGAVLAAGKVPVLPRIAWSPVAADAAAVAPLNEQIDRLVAETPGVVSGPDLYAALLDDDAAFDGGRLSDTGVEKAREAWAAAMRANVYGLP
jgi:hypothetical protein